MSAMPTNWGFDWGAAIGDPRRAPVMTITVDQRALDSVAAIVAGIPGGMRRVSNRAINRVGERARSRISRELQARIEGGALQLKAIRGNVRLYRAAARRPYATVRIIWRGIPLIRLRARQIRLGVSYVGAAGRQLLAGAFIARMPRGHRGVFARRVAGGRRVGRLPIVEQRGPSLAQFYREAPGLAERIVRETYTDLQQEMITQARVYLEQYVAAHPTSRVAGRVRLAGSVEDYLEAVD